MTNEISFQINSKFLTASSDKNAESWTFTFADNLSLNISAFWRLIINDKIYLVSLDNEHTFGTSKPVDIIELLVEKLDEQSLLEIKIKKDLGDLVLTLTKNIRLEIFISSTGFESYKFSLDDKIYIGMGSGELYIIEDNQSHST